MHSNDSSRSLRDVVGVSALSIVSVWLGSEVRGATIVPMTQQRSVNAMVMVPPCGPPGVISDNDLAINYLPFEGEADASLICDFAQGIATGAQQSAVEAAALIATADVACNVVSVNPTVIHAIPGSVFRVTFLANWPVRFFIEGELSASGSNPVVVSFARLQLTAQPNNLILNQQVTPAPGGATNTLFVNEIGTLEAGQYTFLLETTAAVDASVPPNGSGAAAFDITARFQRPGDANIDGLVNVDDLLAVVVAWGACPAEPAFCPIDMDGDGAVEVDDLLLAIVNWD